MSRHVCVSVQVVNFQVRIQDLVKGGPVCKSNVAEWSCASKASYLQPARLRALEAFEFLMLKYAFSHILETLFLSFLTSTSRAKTYSYY